MMSSQAALCASTVGICATSALILRLTRTGAIIVLVQVERQGENEAGESIKWEQKGVSEEAE